MGIREWKAYRSEVFIHFKHIQTDDRFPFLVKDVGVDLCFLAYTVDVIVLPCLSLSPNLHLFVCFYEGMYVAIKRRCAYASINAGCRFSREACRFHLSDRYYKRDERLVLVGLFYGDFYDVLLIRMECLGIPMILLCSPLELRRSRVEILNSLTTHKPDFFRLVLNPY
jgi:hypothetical protein